MSVQTSFDSPTWRIKPLASLLLLGLFAWTTSLVAQDRFGGGLQDFGGLGLPTVGGQPVEFSAEYKLDKDGKKGTIAVTATLGEGYHIYSTTQPEGGPYATSISAKDDFVKLDGKFKPDRDPEIHQDEKAYPGLDLEEFYDKVTWTANINVTKAIDPKSVDLKVFIDALVCRDSCRPYDANLNAKFAGYIGDAPSSQAGSLTDQVAESEEAPPGLGDTSAATMANASAQTPTGTETLRAGKSHAVWSATISPATVKPGETALIQLKAINDPGYHVYQFLGDEEIDFRTLIVATEKSGLNFGTPNTNAEQHDAGLENIMYHEGEVVWQIPVKVPADAVQGSKAITLQVGFYTCNESSCDRPEAVQVQGNLKVAAEANNQLGTMLLSNIDFNDVAGSDFLATSFDSAVTASDIVVDSAAPPTSSIAGTEKGAEKNGESTEENALSNAATSAGEKSEDLSFGYVLLLALGGGFILNFMPCVLPVLGLKVMSFVKQAGSSHSRVVGLNLSYSAGILAIMLGLAALTVGVKVASGQAFAWGEQFTFLELKVFLACFMFAMGLSFLGVWEIPIPGFATSNKSGELMEKDGMLGAFYKGGITTILATPCSGPLLSSALAYSVTLTTWEIVAMYMMIGLGLALPFIVLCFHPKFIEKLPKPGAWMDTFKQVLAFPLLLSMVYFVTTVREEYRIATLILIVFVWFGCWLIGRVPSYEDSGKKLKAWSAALVIIAVSGIVSFKYFGPIDSEIEWLAYEEEQLDRFRAQGKTVMLDFTANWCLNCQYNSRFAIDREEVAKVVHKNNVVTMLADWTSRSQAIRDKLEELENPSIPLLVIYPPGPDSEPIVLPYILTETTVIKALNEAGPSLAPGRLTSLRQDQP
ncbi:MAG: thioredoxin family protein [Planctomycetota bacterium]